MIVHFFFLKHIFYILWIFVKILSVAASASTSHLFNNPIDNQRILQDVLADASVEHDPCNREQTEHCMLVMCDDYGHLYMNNYICLYVLSSHFKPRISPSMPAHLVPWKTSMKLLQNLNVILYFFACSLAKMNMSHFSQFLLNWILMHYSPSVYTQQETPKAHFADKQLLKIL